MKKQQAEKVVLLGSGNVATQLGSSLKAAGFSIAQVISRNQRTGKSLAKKLGSSYQPTTDTIDRTAQWYLLAVKDDQIRNLVDQLQLANGILLHTGGTIPLDVLKKGASKTGVLYPIQSISVSRNLNLREVPFCIEGNTKTVENKIKQFARKIADTVIPMNSAKRKTVHLAAVFTNNFSNELLVIAENLLKENGLAPSLIKPLFLETALKVQHTSAVTQQTGPAKRGDKKVLKEHMDFLKEKPELLQLYKLMSKLIVQDQQGNNK